MLRATRTRGRRCALLDASAAVACLAAFLTACAANSDGGYVAVGPPRPSATAVRPTGSVTLVPLDAPRSPAAGEITGHQGDFGISTGHLFTHGRQVPS